jgi:hypothetical protein
MTIHRNHNHSNINECQIVEYTIYNWRANMLMECVGKDKQGQMFEVHNIKSNPITGLDRPLGFQEVELPDF